MPGDIGEGYKGEDNLPEQSLPLSVSTALPGAGPGVVCPERAPVQVSEEMDV